MGDEIQDIDQSVNQILESRYKNWQQLENYFNCFKHSKSAFSHKDRKAIELAAKHYNLPYQLVFCTLFQESRFVTRATSGVGAQGLAQFMPTTVTHMRNLHRKPRQQVYQRCLDTFDQLNSRGQTYCQAIFDRMENHGKWNELNQIYKENKLVRNRIAYDANDRISAIALGTFFLKRLVDMVAGYYSEDVSSPYAIDMRTFKLALAGYNAGPGRVSRALAKLNGSQDREAALGILRRIEETKNHMDGIEHCMRQGDGQAPTVFERERNVICSDV